MVTAEVSTLRDLARSGDRFVVPDYQRPYQWGHPQVERLWGDVHELLEDRRAGRASTHFLGPLILAPATEASSVTAAATVVDGQQRLISLHLLLAALRDRLAATADASEAARRIDVAYLTAATGDTAILASRRDRDSLEAIIRGDDEKVSGPTGRAYRHFHQRLEALGDRHDLLTLLDVLVDGLIFVVIRTGEEDDVHRIFRSLNTAGLRPAPIDLVREHTFLRLPEAGTRAFDRFWVPLEDELGAEELERLLWLDLAREYPNARREEVFTLHERRLDAAGTEEDVLRELTRLRQLATVYQLILSPGQEEDPAVRSRLSRLRDWGSGHSHALVLELLRRRDDGAASSRELADALRVVESFLVRRLLVDRLPQNLTRLFREAVSGVPEDGPLPEAVLRWFSTGRRHFIPDEDLRHAVVHRDFYRNSHPGLRQTFIRWLEEELGGAVAAPEGHAVIRHVTPPPLADAHTLGNLVLLERDERLEDSTLRFNSSVRTQEKWGPEEIAARSSMLADAIITAWPGPDAASGHADNPAAARLHRILAALPTGRWTSHRDLGAAVGLPTQEVANLMGAEAPDAAHRVLRDDGTVLAVSRRLVPLHDTGDRELLESEGVAFSAYGHADPRRRLSVEELTALGE